MLNQTIIVHYPASILMLQTANTPFWVPLSLIFLMLLLLVWGLTRGNVRNENLTHLVDEEIAEDRNNGGEHP